MKVDQVQHEFFRQLIARVESTGVNSKQLFGALRHRGITASDTTQALAEARHLLETATELTGDPCLALHLGQELGIACYGSFGFALMSCANLRESVQLLLRYGHVMFRPTWTAYDHEDGLVLRANIVRGNAAQQQLIAELIFSNIAAVGRSLYGNQIENTEGAEIQLSYGEPSHSACYQTIFRMPVTFNCEHSQLLLPAQILDTPVRTANRSEHVVFHQQCEEMLRSLNSVEKTTTAVRQLLIQSAGDFLNLEQVADRLHISARTLKRRLKTEATSFRSTLEEIRDLLAREYLSTTELTVAEIAHLLNYAETVNFRRAFVRWNGITPNQYRQQQSQ